MTLRALGFEAIYVEVIRTELQVPEVRTSYHFHSLETKSSQCHY